MTKLVNIEESKKQKIIENLSTNCKLNEDNLKNEDDLKNEEDIKNEDDLKNDDDLENCASPPNFFLPPPCKHLRQIFLDDFPP